MSTQTPEDPWAREEESHREFLSKLVRMTPEQQAMEPNFVPMTTDTPNTVTGTDVGGDVEKLIAEIEARANAATPGPWENYGGTVATRGTGYDRNGDPADDREKVAYSADDAAEFIAHAREDIPTLIELARTLQQRIDNAREVLGGMILQDAQDGGSLDYAPAIADDILAGRTALTATETSEQ